NLPFHKQVENFGKITKCSMNEILKVSSLNASKSINQQKHFGNIIKGAESNFVLLNNKYELQSTFINGQLVK
ncbi:MAG: amidohydrolase family protein, partial [Mycoplasmataceae bacterium]|nr:amidohydrolase family protein [Mycoplasmataceae bacterium]